MTHGKLLFQNKIEKDQLKCHWLHTYHTGHAWDAYLELKHMARWLAARAEYSVIHNWTQEDEQRHVGQFGPSSLDVFFSTQDNWQDQSDESFKKSFQRSWDSFLGVNIGWCDAARMATLMIQRHFDKWHCTFADEIPYMTDGEPDITINCNATRTRYSIIPSKETIELHKEMNPIDPHDGLGLIPITINFQEDLHKFFLEAAIRLSKNARVKNCFRRMSEGAPS